MRGGASNSHRPEVYMGQTRLKDPGRLFSEGTSTALLVRNTVSAPRQNIDSSPPQQQNHGDVMAEPGIQHSTIAWASLFRYLAPLPVIIRVFGSREIQGNMLYEYIHLLACEMLSSSPFLIRLGERHNEL